MAESLGVSTLELDGDLTKLGRKLDEAERKAKTSAKSAGDAFSKDLKRATVPALAALGAIGLGVVKSIDAASDLGEQVNKATVVFEKSALDIIAWGRTTASSLGISNRAALEAAGTFGNMLKPMGLAVPLTAKMSRGLVELAADLASFNNASPEDTLEALRSGLSGETEPLRKFGVFLNEARVQAEAMRLGLVKNVRNLGEVEDATTRVELATDKYREAVAEHGKESEEARRALLNLHGAERSLQKATEGSKTKIDAAAKAQATYSLILKDTTDAQGDFARTSDSLANAQRIMRAEVEDLAAQMGVALLPAVQDLLGFGLELVQVIGDNETAFKLLVVAVGSVSAAILLANTSLSIYNAQLLTTMKLSKGLRLAMALTPWAVAAVGAALLVDHFMKTTEQATYAETAQRDLNSAVRDYNQAIKEGKDARQSLEQANQRLTAADIELKRAKQELTRVQKDDKASVLDLREAQLRLARAQGARREAVDGVKVAERDAEGVMRKSTVTANRMETSMRELTEAYRGNLIRTREGKVATEGLAGAANRARLAHVRAADGVEGYASKLRSMANVTRSSNPGLARTADLAANLAVAWNRVVSLPAARNFVARFTIFTKVEGAKGVFSNPDARASGGNVLGRQPYWVGESGPELFWPHVDGAVTSHMASTRFAESLLSTSTPVGSPAVAERKVENHFHFPRYVGTRRDLIADIRKGVDEHRRATGGQEPW